MESAMGRLPPPSHKEATVKTVTLPPFLRKSIQDKRFPLKAKSAFTSISGNPGNIIWKQRQLASTHIRLQAHAAIWI